jgi:hypothetical protein
LRVRVVEDRVGIRLVDLRVPFGFGASRLTWAPVAYLQVWLEDEQGRRAAGLAADLLPAGWFDKRPGRKPGLDHAELLASARLAGDVHARLGLATLFDRWSAAGAEVLAWARERDVAALTAGWGPSLFERATLDAQARLVGVAARETLSGNLPGIDLAALDDRLAGVTPKDVLPAMAPARIWVRHTVGLADSLAAAPPVQLSGTGEQPRSLEEAIQSQGLRFFKIKVAGRPEEDLDRLEAIAATLDELDWYAVTLDGNEQYPDWSELASLVRGLTGRPRLRRLAAAIRFLEQPLPRGRETEGAGSPAARAVQAWRPLLLDEGDDTPEAWPQAAAAGWRGVSFKGCKGFTRALRNLALAHRWKREGRGEFVLSAEDLTAPPGPALHQHLVLGSLLGLEDQERNGHHYTPGLAWLPPGEAEALLAAHPDLYWAAAGQSGVRIVDGRMELGSLLARPGIGGAGEPEWDTLIPASQWRPEEAHA